MPIIQPVLYGYHYMDIPKKYEDIVCPKNISKILDKKIYKVKGSSANIQDNQL